ncbi:MAG: RDD family protein [Vicinamibacterales bacterium]
MDNPYAPPAAPVADIVVSHDELVPASRGIRLGATMVDGAIFSALVYLPFFLGLMPFVARGSAEPLGGAAIVALAFSCIGFVVWAWFTIRYVRANGQSIAKRWFGIKVVRANGLPVTLGRVFWLRNVVNSLLSAIPVVGFLYGLADALFIFSDSRQCLHDKLADTIVVVD